MPKGIFPLSLGASNSIDMRIQFPLLNQILKSVKLPLIRQSIGFSVQYLLMRILNRGCFSRGTLELSQMSGLIKLAKIGRLKCPFGTEGLEHTVFVDCVLFPPTPGRKPLHIFRTLYNSSEGYYGEMFSYFDMASSRFFWGKRRFFHVCMF